jgi:CheY-like chemotaxis protein
LEIALPLMVVIEDDAVTRLLICQMLVQQGHDVMSAENGVQGMELIHELKPKLIISDVQMPYMDGFAVLEAVRQSDSVATTPVILLTSLQERSDVRHGMTAGADDYLTKPFTSEELREAVDAQINKMIRADIMRVSMMKSVVGMELDRQRQAIAKLYEDRLVRAISEQWPVSAGAQELEKFSDATVLYVDILDYALWNEKLSSEELSEVVQLFYSSVADTVHIFGAHHMQFLGEGMLCVFVDDADTQSVNHSMRAVRAATGLGGATHWIEGHVRQRFPNRSLPRFAVTLAMHSGPVSFTKLDGLFGSASHRTPVGTTVTTALRLFQATPALPWTIACSVKTARLMTGTVQLGRRGVVQVPGQISPLEVVEVLSLAQ